jgi:photosystem II stability/assembly factor-like uncharacterized protein
MSYQEPDPSPPSDRRLFIGLGVTALAVVIAAVVVIVLVTHSQGSSAPSRAALHPTATTVTAPHIVSTTASATSSTAQASGALDPDGGPVPTGFQPESFTAVSDDVWWVLGSAACASPPCTSIVRTADGGHSFVGIPAPRTSAVDQLRFANARDGYAYGTQLWSTHDGGASWTQVTAVTGTVQSLAASDGYVYAALGADGLMRSAVGSDRWSTVQAGDISSIWTQGNELFADDTDANGGQGALLTSADGGDSFQSQAAPAGTVACNFASTGDGVIWAQCATGMLGGVWRSIDGGARWGTADPGSGTGEQPNSAPLAAASADTAVYGAGPTYRTTDGGRTWSTVPGFGTPSTSVAYLGFTDPTHGVAILDSNGTQESTAKLEVTNDGGASYSPVTIAPG